MTRYELEEWCEKFLQDITENAKPAVEATYRLINEDITEQEFVSIVSGAKTYKDYRKQLADFIEEHAKEINK